MGPQGGDELNQIKPGGNHGWPIVTWGFDYSGRAMSTKQSSPGFIDPVLVWSPSISPFGLTFYNGNAFPNWYGDFFVGILSNQTVLRVRLDKGVVLHQENLLPNHNERIRTVETGPDGFIYAVTDSSRGKILRLRPGEPSEEELKNVSLPFDMPKNINLGERLRKHGVMQDEETMVALQINYNKKRAEFIYNQNCISCHNLSANEEKKVGPHLEGIAGRRSGSLPDYPYSTAMTLNDATSVIWDDRSLTAFLTNPQSYYPGTKMVAPSLSYKDALQVGTFLTIEKNSN
jgi:cytochrome c2